MCVRLSLATLLLTISAFAQTPVTVIVDAAADRHTIDSRIYGVAFATAAQLSELNVPTNRSGGNSATRYNWQGNASNRAQDWFFESIAEETGIAGGSADSFIAGAKSAHAGAMITIPMIGWVAKLGPNRGKMASFSVAKYGVQQSTDFYMPDAGNGVRSDGSLIAGNDPHDASVPSDAQFQAAWVRHMVSTWGAASSGGVRYYLLDNEPSIWFATHRDVHPQGARMDEVLADMIAYASAIKGVDAGALVLGPEEWGWSGYFYSGYDQQWGAAHNWSSFPDRESHGGRDYIPYLLQQLKARQDADGARLLDILTVHYYPQGGEFSDDVSPAMQLRRNRSTHSLWDPNYKDESWIDDKVALIPRLRGWINAFYPGTMTGITEYNWGAEKHINGATAQADILGIFGREGIDVANRWTTPESGTPAYNAIRMYRNYDGRKSAFGEMSVRGRTRSGYALRVRCDAHQRRRADGHAHLQSAERRSSSDHQYPEPHAYRSCAGLATNVVERDHATRRHLAGRIEHGRHRAVSEHHTGGVPGGAHSTPPGGESLTEAPRWARPQRPFRDDDEKAYGTLMWLTTFLTPGTFSASSRAFSRSAAVGK